MVDMVTIMMTEPDLRDRLRDRIESVVRDDTRVLVAHSLGSVLCYTALANHPRLAGPHLRHARVSAGRADGLRHTRARPRRRARPVAGLGRALGQRAGPAGQGGRRLAGRAVRPRVEEHVIDNGHRPHAPEPYLNAWATGAAIAAALT